MLKIFNNYQEEAARASKGHSAAMRKSIFTIFIKAWFIEGLFFSTAIAFLWMNEEPSKLNTLFASWSAYVLIALVIFYSLKFGVIIKPKRWVRVYFVMSIFMLFVCDFLWLRGSIARATGPVFDSLRFDAHAVLLAEGKMDPAALTLSNYTGVVWYAGWIYWIFGVSKFYVVLFNGVLSFTSCVLFVSIMKNIEGHPHRWQWIRFGMLLPDFIIHFTNVSKEPLAVFIMALGIWAVSECIVRKRFFSRFLFVFILAALLGLAVRAAITAVIFIIAFLWFWCYVQRWKRLLITVVFISFIFFGQVATDFIAEHTGSMGMNWGEKISLLVDPGKRLSRNLEYSDSSSWNLITESAPTYLIPFTAPLKGFFMMIAPMPLWKLHVGEIVDSVSLSDYSSPEFKRLFPKLTAGLFIFSLPLLMAGLLDTYHINRALWVLFPLTFCVLVAVMGFAIYGMIEARYRPMLLLFWMATAGIGYYYGRPRRYVIPCLGMIMLGGMVYLIPKLF